MTRHRPGGGKRHRVVYLGAGDFEISWEWDHYYPGCRQRFSRHMARVTNRAGAVRFAKKWGLPEPTEEKGWR